MLLSHRALSRLCHLRSTTRTTQFTPILNNQNPRLHSTMAESSLSTTKTEALYQKDGHKYTHTAPISTIQPLSSLPEDTQSLFKPPPEGTSDPHIITTPSTIFHAQGGGQPSDTGTITAGACTFTVHQVRRAAPSILHMGTFSDDARFTPEEPAHQHIDTAKRMLHSRIHTAGHVIGLAAAALRRSGALAADVVDGKASHYPGAAFVEFVGLIPGTLKAAIQTQTDELVARDLPVRIHFWDEARARAHCTGVLESFKQDEHGVRVVEIGDAGMFALCWFVRGVG